MSKKNTKPTLIAVGDHMIDPTDVSCISKVQSGKLYIVRLKSQPNMEYPIWVKKHQIEALVAQYNVIITDTNSEDDIDEG